uniref:CSON012370 protein n=1 Tax=Culicoides sonorensis TaxID=179676 RepID=A0A336KKU4_CULSO
MNKKNKKKNELNLLVLSHLHQCHALNRTNHLTGTSLTPYFLNPVSRLQKSRISGISNKIIASLSKPRPKAYPIEFLTPVFCKISSRIMPQPNTSIHFPLCKISNSHEGCVNGKYVSTQRHSILGPNKDFAISPKIRFNSCSMSLTASKV